MRRTRTIVSVPDWLSNILPTPVAELLDRLSSPGVLLVLAVFSVATFVASLVGVPFFLTRLPQDHFSRRERQALGIESAPRPPWQLALRLLKNALGLVLCLLGLLLLVLPGQGLLTLIVGLLLLEFPGKRRIERWIIGRPSVLRAINKLRDRAGRPPLEPRASWLPPAPPTQDDVPH